MANCEYEGCSHPARKRGLCGTHYERFRRSDQFESIRITNDPARRFWNYVDDSGECWLWTGGKATGYGRVYWNGKQDGAHRVAYELLIGPIPDDAELDHLCRNSPCVNPAHLEPVTHTGNMERAPGWTGNRTHCPKGHKRTRGQPCRECNREACADRAEKDRVTRRSPRQCSICGTSFETTDSRRMLCSKQCQLENRKRRQRDYSREWQRRKRAAS